ncbi:MAG: nucleoside phosphorylase [Candidatus Aureabacteria bacterium]|nr:nucleoside phosphorylase [Candidatus Auribacterota bacterium]
MAAEYPILEFDATREAFIEPSKILKPVPGIPEHCVLPIYHTVIEGLRARKLLTHVTNIGTSMGPMPVYRMTHEGKELAVAHPGLCAPFAAAVLEELIAFGCRKFIACGSAGVLDSTLAKGTVVVPNRAVRDEGTSYHYVSPSREIATEPEVVAVIESVLRAQGVKYQVGKTWTTDAIYRETKDRIAKRKSEGCLTVEMECSALLAVAKFRGVRFGQLLAIRDDVSGNEWDPGHTEEHNSFPERLFWLSVASCVRL